MNLRLSFAATLFGILFLAPLGSHCEGAAVKIEMNSGEVVVGQWAGTTGTSIRLDEGATTREFPVDQVVSLRLDSPDDSSTGPGMNVTLVNGSSIFAQGVSLDGPVVKIEPRRQSMINVPIDQVRSIRFRLGGPATDPQWLGLLEKQARSDLMVIRRGSDQLDPIEGVVTGLDAQNLLFELDGDKIEAPRDRLEGVLFRNADASSTMAKVKITDINGSTYFASRLEANDAPDSVLILLPGQIRHSIPMAHVKLITWASGRVMLATATPAATKMSPYLKTKLPESLMSDWFGPFSDGEDLILVAGGMADYRVEPGFQTLAGSVSRDQLVAAGGTVVIRLIVDDEVQWEQSLTDSSPKGFSLPVGGARRVQLEVLAGDDGDVGDQVRFLKPRLLK